MKLSICQKISILTIHHYCIVNLKKYPLPTSEEQNMKCSSRTLEEAKYLLRINE